MVTVEQVRQLDKSYTRTIPEDFRDENGHMNVQYYVHLFEGGVWHLLQHIGMDEAFMREHNYGNFALEQHLRYFAEIHIGDEISVYVRVVGLSAKRQHLIGFLVNDTRDQLSATVEVIGMNIDMSQRRGAPFPPSAKAKFDALLADHSKLDWDAPLCGVMKP